MHSYRRLEAWKQAHGALMLLLRATDERYHPRSRALFDQMKRAAISVEANIVEGYALGTPALCRRHLRIAFGSAAEAETLARAAGEAGYMDGKIVMDAEARLGAAMRALRTLLKNPPTGGA